MLISIRPSVNIPPANPYGTVTVSEPLCLTSPVRVLRLNCHTERRMEAKETTQAGRRQVEKRKIAGEEQRMEKSHFETLHD